MFTQQRNAKKNKSNSQETLFLSDFQLYVINTNMNKQKFA
jgi:hypothetical protein